MIGPRRSRSARSQTRSRLAPLARRSPLLSASLSLVSFVRGRAPPGSAWSPNAFSHLLRSPRSPLRFNPRSRGCALCVLLPPRLTPLSHSLHSSLRSTTPSASSANCIAIRGIPATTSAGVTRGGTATTRCSGIAQGRTRTDTTGRRTLRRKCGLLRACSGAKLMCAAPALRFPIPDAMLGPMW